MTANDLSSFAGLTAMCLLTVNILLGLLVTTNYNTVRQWPHRKLPAPLFKIHNWTAYVAMAAVLLHPTLLLFVGNPHFRIGDILLPVSSPAQTLYNNFGALAFYSIVLVVVSSYFRPRLGYRPWKKLHYVAYAAAAFLFVHGTLIDPNLKGAAPDFFDGEKVLVEGCGLTVITASLWRWKYGKEKQRYRSASDERRRLPGPTRRR
jgi:sulfoxide reductase heme-binding subunit YedZ